MITTELFLRDENRAWRRPSLLDQSGRNKGALSGLRSFTASFKTGGGLLVGTGGVALEKFLAVGAEGWMG